MKGLPLSYNRDYQEDKEPLFDAVDQIRLALGAVSGMIATATWIPERMQAAADAVVTVNAEIAAELAQRLRLATTPTVVLSAPELEPEPRHAPPAQQLRAVYQGAMGPGRALDDLLAAAVAAPSVHLSIRVAGADIDALRQRIDADGMARRVAVLDPVAPDRLVAALAGFDVGLIINRPVTRNDELVLPNKFFEYLMAGLAVVGPRLPSLGPMIEHERVGLTFAPGDPTSMAEALERLAQDSPLGVVLAAALRWRREHGDWQESFHQMASGTGIDRFILRRRFVMDYGILDAVETPV